MLLKLQLWRYRNSIIIIIIIFYSTVLQSFLLLLYIYLLLLLMSFEVKLRIHLCVGRDLVLSKRWSFKYTHRLVVSSIILQCYVQVT